MLCAYLTVMYIEFSENEFKCFGFHFVCRQFLGSAKVNYCYILSFKIRQGMYSRCPARISVYFTLICSSVLSMLMALQSTLIIH